jgi:hypothetical protein
VIGFLEYIRSGIVGLSSKKLLAKSFILFSNLFIAHLDGVRIHSFKVLRLWP